MQGVGATVVVPIILAIKMSLYADVLYKPQDYRFIGLGNSIWVCSVTMVATTAVSVLAGYAIARFRFAGRDALLLIFLATQMFPSILLIAPLLAQWRALGLIDTYQALIYSNFPSRCRSRSG